MKNVIIVGAGGHAKVIADIVLRSGDAVLGFLDDNLDLPLAICNIPVLGTVTNYVNYPDAEYVIGIGNGAARRKIAELLNGVKWYTAIHPNSIISELDVTIGEGTVIMANAVVNPGAQIGDHCIINTAAVIEHDNHIGDYSHISVGAKLAGTVSVGEETWVGIGAAVSNNVNICGGCMIGAGAVVVESIEEPGTYVGVPARRIK